jgi:hypothetical protein
VTSDHRTFFAGWLGNRILASRVETPPPRPARVARCVGCARRGPGRQPRAKPHPERRQVAQAEPNAEPRRAQPERFAGGVAERLPGPPRGSSRLVSPRSGDVAGDDHRPRRPGHLAADRGSGSRTIVYWSGPDPRCTGTGWDLGTGRLVIDGWFDPAAAPIASGPQRLRRRDRHAGTDADGFARPLASPAPTDPPGPAGAGPLAEGPISDFDIRFDPTGTRLAVWIRDPENPGLGTLRLFVIDPVSGLIDPTVDPLPATTALHGFSIDEGRLAWVTPPGQDGEASHVHVLAWTGDEFGEVRSIAADRLFVVR